MSHESVANGIRVQASATQGTERPRQFAAAVGREHPAIQRVRASVRHDVTVWLTDSGDDGEKLHTPEAWTVESTFVSSDGGVALQLSHD